MPTLVVYIAIHGPRRVHVYGVGLLFLFVMAKVFGDTGNWMKRDNLPTPFFFATVLVITTTNKFLPPIREE